eukprot:c9046_g1_i1.p1 GENE.c9046_g1_i1~~c9046_g1_i1.p1  ORF type:complete len:154 (+),score=13.90 c9046_g1_i1:49-462(+)
MSEGTVTLRTRKVLNNRLLSRKQMILDVNHPGKASVSRADLREKIAKMYKVQDPRCVQVYGVKTDYGGGRSSGFALVYDNFDVCLKIEPKHRLRKDGIGKKRDVGRKTRKERKNRAKKFRGTKKIAGAAADPKKKKK